MADGRLVHQPKDANRSVVFGATVYEAPLLPYERDLIATLGCSEEEYRWFVAEAIKRSRVRPAAYDHIPDIQCAEAVYVPILISLAVGVVTTGIGYLLTPKPRTPSATEDPRTQRQLDSIRGGNRFTPSSGFDTTAELADYNSAIPIIFGLYNETERSGGVLVSPRLVWSRMLSYGRQQSAKLLFVVGEQGRADNTQPDGIIEPDLSGIFIGNNALDALYENSFAFYWKRNTTASGFSRILNKNRVFGTGGSAEAADPNAGRFGSDDDVFLCPTRKGEFQKGFCHSYTPSNNAEFGVYSVIPNGTAYRVNWRVISIPSIPGKDDPEGRLDAERTKIAGTSTMSGIGRNYSRRMGLIAHNGTELSSNVRGEVNVQKDDTALFLISDTSIPTDFYDDKTSVEDINTEVESQQIAVDDAMQIGELFSIGSTVWQVIARSRDQYRPGEGDQEITLKCVDIKDAYQAVIGLVSRSLIVSPSAHYQKDGDNGEMIGAGWYPLTKMSRGLIRNSRPCDVTEIGIKSTVFQKLNGICNFMSLPTPAQLEDADENAVTINSGTITSYIQRSSAFTIYVRQAGLDANGNEFEFAQIPLDFVVVGNKPVAQYNFIRINHPTSNAPIEYEFKFVPRNGSDQRPRAATTEYIQLNAAASSTTPSITRQVQVGAYGLFKISTSGKIVDKSAITANKEFFNNVQVVNSVKRSDFPSTIGVDTFLPDDQPEDTTFATSVETPASSDNPGTLVSDPSNATVGRMGAFGYVAFGNPDASGVPIGGRTTFRTREYVTGNRWIELEFDAEKTALPDGHFAKAKGQQTVWKIGDVGAGLNIRVVRSSPGWDSMSTFTIKRGDGDTSQSPNGTTAYPTSNPFVTDRGQPGDLRMSGYLLRVTGVQTTAFVQGRSQGYYYEIFGSAQARNLGDYQSYTFSVTAPNGKKIQVTLRSQVVSEANHWTGQTQLWSQPVVEVVEDPAVTDRSWVVGETFEHKVAVSPSNLFAQHFLQQNKDVGIRYVIEAVAEQVISASQLSGDREFESQSQYADISLYGDLVQKSNESEPEHSIVYVNELVENDPIPVYEKLTTAGLVLRASNVFTRLDQLRVWLSKGVQVRRLHPDLSTYQDSSNSTNEGPSNLFTDLVFYLLTNYTAGAGSILYMDANNPSLINVTDFENTSKFLRQNKLFCNGAITEKVNIREFIGSNAANFLCNFVLSNGKFSIRPAVPTNTDGTISTKPVQIKQIFTSGNILDDTFELEYLTAEERREFTASVRYRFERQNKLPEERTINVSLSSGPDLNPIEAFDLTQFCTSRHHAFMAARYFLALRRLVTHTISFGTTVDGLNLAPGDYIKVVTEASPYSSAQNGVISDTGVITSATEIVDGTYNILYYAPNAVDVQSGSMQVTNGTVSDSTLFDSVFTIQTSTNSENIYLVEQLTFQEDMTVRIVASEFPCDTSQASELAKLVVNESAFTVTGP